MGGSAALVTADGILANVEEEMAGRLDKGIDAQGAGAEGVDAVARALLSPIE